MCKHVRFVSSSRRAVTLGASFHRLRAAAPLVGAASALALGLAPAPRAQAQDNYTYTGTTGTAAAPSASTTFTGAFTDTTTNTPNVTPAATDNTLTFGGTANYAATDDIASLTLSGGLAFTNTAGTVTINAANGATIFGTGTTLGFAVNTGVAVFNPAINLGTSTLAFSGGGTGSQTTIGGVISGTGAMTDSIAGTLTLNNTNTYTGGTTVNAGSTLVLNNGGGAGAIRGVVTVNTGATLSLNVNNALGYSAGSQVTALNINGGTVSVNGSQGDEGYLTSFNLTGGTMAYANGSYQIAAGDATAPKITSNASATTSLISGGVNIRSGNLPIVVASGTTANGVDLQISGVISGGFPITKSGAGLLALSNFNTYTGGTTVNGGTLRLAAGGGGGAVQGAITVNTGATLNLSVGDALGYTAGASVTTINVNGGTVTSNAGNNEGYLTSYNLTGGTVAAGSIFRFNVNAATVPTLTSSASGTTSFFNTTIDDFAQGGATANSNLMVNVATGTTASGVDLQINGVIQSGGGLIKTGSGYLNLTSGASTFTGNVAVNAGTLNIGGGGTNTTSALGTDNVGRTITVSSGATLSGTINNWFGNGSQTGLPIITLNGGTLSTTRYTAIGALNLNGATVTATSSDGGATGSYQAFALRGDVTVGGASASTITSTNVTATTGGYHLGANTTFTVAATGSASPDLTVSAPLINQSGDFGNAAGGLTKAGAGVMALNAANTYTGTTTVNAGTLLVNGSTAAASMVTVGTGTANSGTLGGTGTVGGATTVAAGGAITGGTVGGTPGTLTLSSTLTINGTYVADVAGGAGGASDKLGVGGALTLGSGSTLSVVAQGTLSAVKYVLATYASLIGTFTNTAAVPGGYRLSYTATELDLVRVPEPGTWAGGLLLLGSLSYSCRRFGRQKNIGKE